MEGVCCGVFFDNYYYCFDFHVVSLEGCVRCGVGTTVITVKLVVVEGGVYDYAFVAVKWVGVWLQAIVDVFDVLTSEGLCYAVAGHVAAAVLAFHVVPFCVATGYSVGLSVRIPPLWS